MKTRMLNYLITLVLVCLAAWAAVSLYHRYVENPRQDFQNAQDSFAAAQAQLVSAKANLELARLNLSYTKVFATVDGYVTNMNTSEGTYVTAGNQLIARLSALRNNYKSITQNREAIRFLVDPKSTRWQYENGVADRTLLDPTTWTLDQVGLDRPGNAEIQLDLFYSYRTNVPLYSLAKEF